MGFLIFWEIMSLSSLLLVLHDYSSEENKKAGFFYFVMTSLSTAFLFMGFISLFRLTGSAEFGPLEYPASVLTLPFLYLFIGFGVKAGIVPFHKWLPYAHPAAPSSVSALMSGVMLKVAIYGFLRFLLSVSTPELWWGVLILIGGSLSALLGGNLCSQGKRYKKAPCLQQHRKHRDHFHRNRAVCNIQSRGV